MIIVIGANPTVNHPVAATFIKNAVKERGAKLIVIDPRRQALSRHALHHLAFKPGSDVALLNAMLHTIIEEGLTDEQYIAGYTEGFDELRERIEDFSPEKMEPVCGIPARDPARGGPALRQVRASIIFWGMGISQHVHGTDNARCLIALALITGQIGRPGTGLHPLRGQNNVQGASDAGLIPMVYPGLPVGRARRHPRAVRSILGHQARPAARPDGGGDHATRSMPGRSTACTSRARTRRCRTPTSTTPARRWRSSTTLSCRTCS